MSNFVLDVSGLLIAKYATDLPQFSLKRGLYWKRVYFGTKRYTGSWTVPLVAQEGALPLPGADGWKVHWLISGAGDRRNLHIGLSWQGVTFVKQVFQMLDEAEYPVYFSPWKGISAQITIRFALSHSEIPSTAEVYPHSL